MLAKFKKFLADEMAWDMYVSGAAGRGKTTKLKELVAYCMEQEVLHATCAYTHKACGILATKVPGEVKTLHSFLSKRPTVNQHATNKKHISNAKQFGSADEVRILFVDEYSMIGEKDFLDVRNAQDPDYDGVPNMKVVWIGDPHQLPPVGDIQAIKPEGEYQVKLTHNYRQAADNPLVEPLEQLISFIEGADPVPLKTSESFVRDREHLHTDFLNAPDDKVMLAYTNERVQDLNRLIQGYTSPKPGDMMFCPTNQHHYELVQTLDRAHVQEIDTPFNGSVPLNTKYRTLEHLLKQDYWTPMTVRDAEGVPYIRAVVFGHYGYKQISDYLKAEAAESNRAIEREHRGFKAAAWAKANPKTKLARARSKAWRDFLTFNDCVVCLDFPHAMTVHKSQGSTYEYVFLDTEDLSQAANFSYDNYLKLMYVAISRASKMVVTN